MRALAVGKEISFTSAHSLPPNEDVPRDLGNGEIGGLDIASELLKNGWAKVKEFKRDPTEEDNKRRELENEAKSAGKGLWNPHGPQVRLKCILICRVTKCITRLEPCTTQCPKTLKPSLLNGRVNQLMVNLPVSSLSLKGCSFFCFPAIVEHVRDGTTLRARLFMPDGEHQVVNIALAGVRSARASAKQGESSEPWGEEVGFATALACKCLSSLINEHLGRPNSSPSHDFSNVLYACRFYLFPLQQP